MQDEWRSRRAHRQARPALPAAVLARLPGLRRLRPGRHAASATPIPQRQQQLRAAAGARLRPRRATAGRRSTPPTGIFYDNQIVAIASITRDPSGTDGVRTLVVALPASPVVLARLARARPPAPGADGAGAARRLLSEPRDRARSRARDAVRAPGVASASTRRSATTSRSSANVVYVRGPEPARHHRLQPGDPRRCGANDAGPNDADGVGGGTSASRAAVHRRSARRWYKGLTVSLNKRFSHNYQFLAAYTLVEGRGQLHRLPERLHPAGQRPRPQPARSDGLPLGFDPDTERGPGHARPAAPLRASPACYQLAWDFQLSTIVTAASGRPFTPLAGADLNGDGDGGAFPPDRARTNPADEASSVGRNSETTGGHLSLDLRLSKRFRFGRKGSRRRDPGCVQPLRPHELLREHQPGLFTIFGTGVYPSNALPTYGRYTETLPPRQMQLAAKISF